jgi:rhodanese-related sulfurtransferase
MTRVLSVIGTVGLLIPSLGLAGCCGTCGSAGKAAECDPECPPGMAAEKAACGTACVPGMKVPKACDASVGGVEAPAHMPEVGPAALKTLLDSGANVTLLDARTGEYDDGRRIPGARSLAPDASAEAAAEVIPSKDALVVTYCSNLKCPASRMLAKRLGELGYSSILKFPEGIDGWAAAGHPVAEK